MRRRHALDEGLHRRRIGNVELIRLGAAAARDDPCRTRCGRVGVQVRRDDHRAARGHLVRNRESDAGTRTGDDDDLVGKYRHDNS